MSIQRNRIKIRRRASDLHQMFQDFSYFFRIHYNGHDFHWRTARRTTSWIHTIHSGNKPCLPLPCGHLRPSGTKTPYPSPAGMKTPAGICGLTGTGMRIGESTKNRSLAMMRNILAGLKYIQSILLVVVLLALSLATTLLAMPLRLMLPMYVVDVYHRGPEALGLLVSVMGIGAVLGSVPVASIGKWRPGLMLLAGGLVSGVGLLIVGVIPAYLGAAIAMALLGLGDSFRRSLNMALILELVKEEYQGRVSSVYAMNFGLMPLGVVPASIISAYFGPRASVCVLAVLLLAVCSAILITQKNCGR